MQKLAMHPLHYCIIEESTSSVHPESGSSSSRATHTDIAGPINPASTNRKTYMDVFLDDYSRMSMVYFLDRESEYFETLKGYQSLVENEQDFMAYTNAPGLRLFRIRLDRAGEHTSLDVHSYAMENGIVLEYSPPYGSQSNGVAERLIQELWKMARTLLHSTGLPTSLWGEAISHTNWLRNRLPSSRIGNEIPYTRWYGRKPDFPTCSSLEPKDKPSSTD